MRVRPRGCAHKTGKRREGKGFGRGGEGKVGRERIEKRIKRKLAVELSEFITGCLPRWKERKASDRTVSVRGHTTPRTPMHPNWYSACARVAV